MSFPHTVSQVELDSMLLQAHNDANYHPDFEGCTFPKGLDLKGREFHGANLKYCKFQGDDYQHVHFSGANMEQATFEKGANLSYAKFNGTDLRQVDFKEVNLSNASFIDTKFNLNNFESSNLDGTIIRSNIQCTIFTSSDLRKTNFNGSYVPNGEQGAEFNHSNLEGNTNLKMNATELFITKCNLKGVDLSGANLSGGAGGNYTQIHDSNLEGANLRGANLYRVELYGVNLTNANCEGAQLGDSMIRNVTAHGANFTNAAFQKAEIEANLNEGSRGLNPAGAEFRDNDYWTSSWKGVSWDNIIPADQSSGTATVPHVAGQKPKGHHVHHRVETAGEPIAGRMHEHSHHHQPHVVPVQQNGIAHAPRPGMV